MAQTTLHEFLCHCLTMHQRFQVHLSHTHTHKTYAQTQRSIEKLF